MPPSPLITTESHGNSLVIHVLARNLRDAETAQKLQVALVDAVTEQQPESVIIDFAKVELVGSIAFLAFLAVRRQEFVRRILLSSLKKPIRDSFTVCRLIRSDSHPDGPFDVVESVDDALAMLPAE